MIGEGGGVSILHLEENATSCCWPLVDFSPGGVREVGVRQYLFRKHMVQHIVFVNGSGIFAEIKKRHGSCPP